MSIDILTFWVAMPFELISGTKVLERYAAPIFRDCQNKIVGPDC
jgi:hypothetical protein